MNRLALISALICSSSVAMGCECAKSIGSNFLNQIKHFDLIILGTFHHSTETDNITLEIERIYKGQTITKTISLIRGGIDCNHPLHFEDGQRILIGLNRISYSGQSNEFAAPGCVTSVLFVSNKRALTVGRQRIGLLTRTMKLGTIERKIKRRWLGDARATRFCMLPS